MAPEALTAQAAAVKRVYPDDSQQGLGFRVRVYV
jgi:hypothetical protein